MKLFSHLQVTARGLNQNKLLENLQKNNITISHYKRLGHAACSFLISEKNFNKAKKLGLLEKYEIEKFASKSLAYYFWYVPQRIGLVTGVIFALLLSYFLPQYVFSISVSGISTAQEQQVIEILSKNGVKIGRKWETIDLKMLENSIFASIPTSSNVSCKRHGTKLSITLGEATLERKHIGDIVAEFDGTIEHIEVSCGTPLKQKGDLVRAGETIVKAGADGYCCGSVGFRVYMQSSVAVRDHSVRLVRSGKSVEVSKYYSFYQKPQLPNVGQPYTYFEVEQRTEDCFVNFFLPYTKVTAICYELIEEQVPEAEALQAAKTRAYNLAAANLNGIEPELVSYDEHIQNGLKFVDCFIEAVLHLG